MLAKKVENEHRALKREQFYSGEKMTLTFCLNQYTVEGEIINISPSGMAVKILSSIKLDLFVSKIGNTFSGTLLFNDIAQEAQKMKMVHANVVKRNKTFDLIVGFVFETERYDRPILNQRKNNRFEIAEFFQLTGDFVHPILFSEYVYFKIVELSAKGLKFKIEANKTLIVAGLKVSLNIYFPFTGKVTCNVIIKSCTSNNEHLLIGAEIESSKEKYLIAFGEFLLRVDPNINIDILKEEGMRVNKFSTSVRIEFGNSYESLKEVASLRLLGQQNNGRYLETKDVMQMIDEYDSHSRHILFKKGKTLIASTRILFNNGDHKLSELHSYKADIPNWLWQAGFIESSRSVTHPSYRGADLFLIVLQKISICVVQAGYRYIVTSCEDCLLAFYKRMGFVQIGKFKTSDSPIEWHLIYSDVLEIAKTKNVDPMIWSFVHEPVALYLERSQQLPISQVERFKMKTLSLLKPIALKLQEKKSNSKQAKRKKT